jgi:hypothetical protein
MDIEHWIPRINISIEKVSFDIPDYWEEPVKVLILYLIELDPTIQFMQIKSKFGGLRIYAVYSVKHSEEIERLCHHCSVQCNELSKLHVKQNIHIPSNSREE